MTDMAATVLCNTANPAPVRPLGSVRRTSSIDVEWPTGIKGDRVFHGRVRDFRTPADGSGGQVLAAAEMRAVLDFNKVIREIAASPAPAQLPQLVGAKGGGHLRMMIREIMPELIDQAAPLYLALDDISGVALVSSWALSLWHPDLMANMRENMPKEQLEKYMDRAGVCWGLKPGNSGLAEDRPTGQVGQADGKDLRNPADPEGWHLFPEIAGVSMRRARRIDVMLDRDAGVIRVDSAFQDSAPRPDGTRAALHEYRLEAEIDAATLELRRLTPDPRVLPFPECPGAIHNAQRLVGGRLPDIRDAVVAQLRGPEGCTHLNDALRALADVPRLVEQL
jgi:hypothetical protein